MQRQEQIKKENQYNEKDGDSDMKKFVEDIKGIGRHSNLQTNTLQGQAQKIVGINDKLDDYNKEVQKEEELLNIFNKSPFGLLKDNFFGLFKSDKNEQLDKNDRKVIEETRNYNGPKELDNEWTLVQNDQSEKVININKHKGEDQEDILDEALKVAKATTKEIQKFNSTIKDSSKLVDATNNNMDIALNNVNKVNKKMLIHK